MILIECVWGMRKAAERGYKGLTVLFFDSIQRTEQRDRGTRGRIAGGLAHKARYCDAQKGQQKYRDPSKVGHVQFII